jgi:hypothetical protein
LRISTLANPRTARRVAEGVLLGGGLLAGAGTALRAWIEGGNDQWTYLLDTAGLLIAVAGAGLDFRASGILAQFDERANRRRAIAQVALGAISAAGGCYLLGWLAGAGWPALARGALSFLLTFGIGVGLAGLLYIGWFGGGNYLERRIEQQGEEKW